MSDQKDHGTLSLLISDFWFLVTDP